MEYEAVTTVSVDTKLKRPTVVRLYFLFMRDGMPHYSSTDVETDDVMKLSELLCSRFIKLDAEKVEVRIPISGKYLFHWRGMFNDDELNKCENGFDTDLTAHLRVSL